MKNKNHSKVCKTLEWFFSYNEELSEIMLFY